MFQTTEMLEEQNGMSVLAAKVNEALCWLRGDETTMLFTEEEALLARGASITTPLRSNYQAYWLVRATLHPHTSTQLHLQTFVPKKKLLTYIYENSTSIDQYICTVFCGFNKLGDYCHMYLLWLQSKPPTHTNTLWHIWTNTPGKAAHPPSVIYLLAPTQPLHSGWTKNTCLFFFF